MSRRVGALATAIVSAVVTFALVRVVLARTAAGRDRAVASVRSPDRVAPFVYSPRRGAAMAALPRATGPAALATTSSPARGLMELHADVRAQDAEIGARWPRVLNDLVARMFEAIGGDRSASAPCFTGEDAGSGATLFFQVEIAIDSDRDQLRVSRARVLDDALSDAQRRCVEHTLDALAPLAAAEAGGPLPDLRIAIIVPFVVHRSSPDPVAP